MIDRKYLVAVPIFLFHINLPSIQTKEHYEIVKTLAASYYKVSKDMCEVSFTEYGKPYFPKLPSKYFNLSHSGSRCICAFADSEIGIDLEEIKDMDFLKIVNRFFSDKEKKFIFAHSNLYIQRRRFFEIWTKKEAYIKYVGKGLHIPLNSFDVLSSAIDSKLRYICKENYIISICTASCKHIYFDFKII